MCVSLMCGQRIYRTSPPNDMTFAQVKARAERVRDWVSSVLEAYSPSASVELFGSSINRFGSNASDVDVCLVLPSEPTESAGKETDPHDRASKAVVELGKLFAAAGATDVDDRRHTARVPVLKFTEPTHQISTDISIGNVLALRNTSLLRMYAQSDSRVCELVYVMKHWARSRDLNDPSTSTLSSYGLILMMIRFLQRRSPPVLPVLQAVPPDWDGGSAAPISLREEHLKSRLSGDVPVPTCVALPIAMGVAFAF